MNQQTIALRPLKIMLSTELVLDLFLCRYYSADELNKILSWLEDTASSEQVQLYISKTCFEMIHLYLGCFNAQAAEEALIFLEHHLGIEVFDIDLDVRSIQFNLKFPCVDYLFEIKGAQNNEIDLVVTLRPDLYFESNLRVTSSGLLLTNLYNIDELIDFITSSQSNSLEQPSSKPKLLGDALRNANASFIPNHQRKTDAKLLKSDVFLDSEALSELFLSIYLENESRISLLQMLQERPGHLYVSSFGVEKLKFYVSTQRLDILDEVAAFLSSSKVKVLTASEGAIRSALSERHGNSIGLSLEAAIARNHGIKAIVTFRQNTYNKYRLRSFYLEEFAALLQVKSLALSNKQAADSQESKKAARFQHEFHLTEDRNFKGVNLSGQDLSNLDLREADFRGAILHRTNLTQTNLEGANLAGADLSLSDLTRANLKGACLDNAHMEFSNLSYASLHEASLIGSCLNSAKLDYAEITSASFSHAKVVHASLKGAVLNNSDLSDSDVQTSNIEGCSFYHANLTGANLTSCNLKGTALRKAILEGANLEKANLIRTDLTYANLANASLRGAKINNSTMKSAVLTKADFTPLVLKGKVRKTELICVGMARTDLCGANLSNVIARRTNFNDAKLIGATIQGSILLNTSFLDAVLDGASLVGSDFGGAILTEASLVDADLQAAKLEGAYLDRATLDGANLQGAKLNRAFLGKACLKGANLSYCHAHNANFKGADLQEAFLERAQLHNANFESARLVGADLNNALIEGANLNGANLTQANLSSALLRGSVLKGASLVGATLEEAKLQGAYLKDATLVGADLTAASLNYSRLKRAVLSRACLHKASLVGADLRFTQFDDADLSETSLEEANLACASFFAANLQLADLGNASVASASFLGADISYANLAGADLSDAILTRARLKKTNLSRAKLMAANLSYCDLSSANLRLACLSDALLTKATVKSAILTRTNLNGTNASGTRLVEAQMTECTTLGMLIEADSIDALRDGENNESCSYQDRLLDAEEAVGRLIDALKKLKNVKRGFDEKLEISVDVADVAKYLFHQIETATLNVKAARKTIEDIGLKAQERFDSNMLDLHSFSRQINRFIRLVSENKHAIMKVASSPRQQLILNKIDFHSSLLISL